jgi:2-succinyl-6-hydroxy-2,4-cyclohexadiene-1-carboxylate synthase
MNVILALHGFLGSPRDFDPLRAAFSKSNTGFDIIPVDYTNLRGLTPDVTLDRWGENFNLWAQKNHPRGKKVILGYSQGGRLALHAVEKNPQIWSRAVYLSTHPGLASAEEKKSRRESDLRWSQRFQNVDFDRVVKEWNAQAVFVNSSSEPVRKGADYDSTVLGKALTQWSLSQQKDFRQVEAIFKVQSLWMAGELDKKYKELLQELEKIEKPLETAIVEGASHRLMLDEPECVAEYMKDFLQK